MLPKRLIFVPALLLLFIACKKKEQTDASAHTQELPFVTNLDNVRLREAPGEAAPVVATVPKGTSLFDLGEVSDFTTKIKLRGVEFDEPWLKVRTADGTTGWVYAGTLNFAMSDDSKLANLLMQKRLQALFGSALAQQMNAYRQSFQQIASAADFAAVYRTGTALRDTLVGRLGEKITVTDPNELPDLFWLEQALPGFVPQLVAEGTAYYLFWNYKNLLQKATTTPDLPDDDFVHLAVEIFNEDSVEYFYPVWFLQTWDYGGSSLLGRGIHDRMLQRLDESLRKSDVFAPEIRQWKTLLINDISKPDVTYWEKPEKITAELDTILGRSYPILTDADKIALQTRRQQFANPAQYKISVNRQAGGE